MIGGMAERVMRRLSRSASGREDHSEPSEILLRLNRAQMRRDRLNDWIDRLTWFASAVMLALAAGVAAVIFL